MTARIPANASTKVHAAHAAFQIAFAAFFLAYVAHYRFGLLSLSTVLGPLALLFTVGLWRRRTLLESGRERRLLLAGLGISFSLPALATMVGSEDLSVYTLFRGWTVVLLAWSVGLWVPLDLGHLDAPTSKARETSARSFQVAALTALLAYAAALAGFHWMTSGNVAGIIDEVLYVLQSELLGQPGYAQAMDESIHRFFAIKYTVFTEGRYYTQYPPGWPVLLAMFDSLGLRWWSNVLLGTLAICLTYLLGERIHSRFVGLTAAILLATNLDFVESAAGYLAHTAALVCLVSAAWALAGSERAPETIRVVPRLGAGFLLGSAVAIRPLTGLLVGASVSIWMVVRSWNGPRKAAILLGCIALGGLLPVSSLLHYNVVTNGGPLVFGYDVAHDGLQALGFGERGEIRYDDAGERFRHVVVDFTPRVSMRNLALNAQATLNSPLALLLPLITFGLLAGYRIRWTTLAVFSLLPLAHAFYFWTSTRFYIELLPFFLIGIGVLAAQLRERADTTARWLLVALVVWSVFLLPIGLRGHEQQLRKAEPYLAEISRAEQEFGRILVFVSEPSKRPRLFWKLFWWNAEEPHGAVIVARDLGAANVELAGRFPDHETLGLRWANDPEHAGRSLVVPLALR